MLRQAVEIVYDKPAGFAVIEKHRSEGLLSGGLFAGEVAGHDVWIVDDMIESGETMLRAAQAGMVPGLRIKALCGDNFWDWFTNHANVRETYLNWEAASDLRQGNAFSEFTFGDIDNRTDTAAGGAGAGPLAAQCHHLPRRRPVAAGARLGPAWVGAAADGPALALRRQRVKVQNTVQKKAQSASSSRCRRSVSQRPANRSASCSTR